MDLYKLQEDHGNYITVSKARTLMENASKDENLQDHIKNMEKYDIFVGITYIDNGDNIGMCKTRHIIILNTNPVPSIKGMLSRKTDCIEFIPITTSKTSANTEYQNYKFPIINRYGANLSTDKDLYINLRNLYKHTFENEKLSTLSKSEIIGYVGKLQREDINTIATNLYNWKRTITQK